MMPRKAWNVLIAITIASGVLALGDTMDPTKNGEKRGRSADQFDSESILKWVGPSGTPFADPASRPQEGGVNFQDLGFQGANGERQGDRDLDFFFFRRDHDHDHDRDDKGHHHDPIPEPSTFLLLGTALIYCSRLLGRRLPRV